MSHDIICAPLSFQLGHYSSFVFGSPQAHSDNLFSTSSRKARPNSCFSSPSLNSYQCVQKSVPRAYIIILHCSTEGTAFLILQETSILVRSSSISLQGRKKRVRLLERLETVPSYLFSSSNPGTP